MPQFAIDLPTLLAMTVIGSVVMAAGLVLVGHDRRREGLGLWAAALMLQSLAYVLLALRGRVPDAVSIVIANGLLSSVFASLLAAVCQFHRRPLPWAWLLGPVGVTLALFLAFIQNYEMRLVLAGVIYPVQLAMVLWTLWRFPSPGRGATLVVVGVVLQMVVLVARAAAAATGAMPLNGLLEGSWLQHATFLSTFISVQASSFGFIFMARDRADETNRRMAARDPLTGVANRRATIDALARDMSRAIRTREPLSLMMVDIDHFKRINDGLGHLVGDQVLCGVVDAMGERLRAQDMIGRYGGEEFLVLLPDTPLHGARQLAIALCRAVEQSHFEIGGHTVPVTLSIGVFGGRIEEGDSWDMLIAAADRAMYEAKRSGRNRVAVAGDLRGVVPMSALHDNPETLPPPDR
ncbi:GGDEF domain-containing protein [Paracidovorax valerianellae]|uniref:diguanylate cyclase n=1 Tax=Paracidovorax valerianellae TaxID=187868 RepID=A0A1G6RNC8_9BURK|nr:GGDEF domain-containing protein [Paracidovorax valerianellae]MDA8444082.1 GGDEF domain-containing protein [Paracidovorax valerianellae]SDD05457.1 diguanylate cyclase (GGDEF) domain-containing protein [Paracidovorax valerianellae]